MKNIYVGNLPRSVNEESLKQAFAPYAKPENITKVNIIKDKFTGESRGFGFLTITDDAEAQAAIDGLNGKELEGRKLTVNEAREPEARSPRPGGGGNRFGGSGGGDRGGRGGNGGGFRSNRY